MRRQVALVGQSEWLSSAPLRQLRLDRCINSVLVSSPIKHRPRELDQFDKKIGLVLYQFRDQIEAACDHIRSLAERNYRIRCIAVTDLADDDCMSRLIEVGAWGHCFQSASTRHYTDAIDKVSAGRLSYPDDVLDRISTYQGQMSLEPSAGGAQNSLTPQEREILLYFIGGCSLRQISRTIGKNLELTNQCLNRALEKLDAAKNAQQATSNSHPQQRPTDS